MGGGGYGQCGGRVLLSPAELTYSCQSRHACGGGTVAAGSQRSSSSRGGRVRRGRLREGSFTNVVDINLRRLAAVGTAAVRVAVLCAVGGSISIVDLHHDSAAHAAGAEQRARRPGRDGRRRLWFATRF